MRNNAWRPTKAGVYAVSAGIIAAVTVYMVLNPLVRAEEVIVAKKHIPAGARVSESMVEKKKIFAGDAGPDVYHSACEVVGKSTTIARLPGDCFSVDCVTEKAGGAVKHQTLSPGELIFLLPVADLSMYTGMIGAGTRVNVITASTLANPSRDEAVTLLSGVEVVKVVENKQASSTKTGQGLLI